MLRGSVEQRDDSRIPDRLCGVSKSIQLRFGIGDFRNILLVEPNLRTSDTKYKFAKGKPAEWAEAPFQHWGIAETALFGAYKALLYNEAQHEPGVPVSLLIGAIGSRS